MTDEEKTELDELRIIVAGFDKVVRNLTKKYLKDAPRGRLPLESFFDLITTKIRKFARERALEEFVTGAVLNKIEQIGPNSVMFSKESLKTHIYIPVLVRNAHRRDVSLKRYAAHSLRGDTRKSTAETPETAYALLREHLADTFSKDPSTFNIKSIKNDLMEEYDMAKFLLDDVVAGFRVIVKISEIDSEEGEIQ